MRRRLAQTGAACVLLLATLAADQPRAAATPLPEHPTSSPPVLYSQPDYTDLERDTLVHAATETLRAGWAAHDAELARIAAEQARAAADAHAARLATIDAGSWHRLTPDILEMVISAADAFGIDPRNLARKVVCESGGNPRAVNPISRASGLTQQLPQYWPGRALAAGIPGADVFDPWSNLYVAAHMLTRGDTDWAESRSCWRG